MKESASATPDTKLALTPSPLSVPEKKKFPLISKWWSGFQRGRGAGTVAREEGKVPRVQKEGRAAGGVRWSSAPRAAYGAEDAKG